MAILFCIFCLSACGLGDRPSSRSQSQDQESAAPPPATASADTSYTVAPLPPPGIGDRPPLPGQTGRPLDSEGLPVMESRGPSADQLFAEVIDDEERRFDRLENAVTEIRRDLDALMPPIIRLIAVEKDINALVTQLETLLQEDTTAPPYGEQPWQPSSASPVPLAPSPAPAPVPVTPSAQNGPVTQPPLMSAPSPMPNGSPAIRQMRTGEHTNKTRIVFDASGPISYRYDVDNQENIMVVELPGAGWNGPVQGTLPKSPVIASYNVFPIEGNGGGSRVVLQLKRDTRVIYQTTIKPNGTSNFRVVLDLEK